MRFCTTTVLVCQDHEDEKYQVYCPCGRPHKECLEQEGLVEFMQKDMKMSQLCLFLQW